MYAAPLKLLAECCQVRGAAHRGCIHHSGNYTIDFLAYSFQGHSLGAMNGPTETV